MTDEIVRLVHKYRSRGVLVDTNILLLYFVGKYQPDQISRFKRTQSRGFTADDYYLLLAILAHFHCIVTTPNILTEVSNLLGQFHEPAKTACWEVLAQEIVTIDERFVPSGTVAQTEGFHKLGLTDSGILSLARESYLVLTEDFLLAHFLLATGVDVLNFNSLRSL